VWRDYHLCHDQTPHYEYGKTMLKILDWQSGYKKRWVLKCPQHYEQLPAIMKVYPDATVVFTHRDPVSSLQINCNYGGLQRTHDGKEARP